MCPKHLSFSPILKYSVTGSGFISSSIKLTIFSHNLRLSQHLFSVHNFKESFFLLGLSNDLPFTAVCENLTHTTGKNVFLTIYSFVVSAMFLSFNSLSKKVIDFPL